MSLNDINSQLRNINTLNVLLFSWAHPNQTHQMCTSINWDFAKARKQCSTCPSAKRDFFQSQGALEADALHDAAVIESENNPGL